MAAVKGEPRDDRGFNAPPTPTHDDEPRIDLQWLQELVNDSEKRSVHVLERAVRVGVKALEGLKGPLEAAKNLEDTSAAQWLKLINDVQSRAKPTRTIVGVVGNTGAGKSSVISAVLDEERLLATNCMRACTASPTEISYNDSKDPNELYRAEVEFITSAEWLKELQELYSDLLDGSGEVSRESSNEDSEAGIAYAKIKAVYPRLVKDTMPKHSPVELVNQPSVRNVLGTTRKLQATTASGLYRQLQSYVDSKEKNTDKSIEYWPLIKVVRIYTKASVLSTGVCLVDLPGVQDSNAARAAVAANYMKACTGLWIVAPITRAVDDKTAKSLLGDTFKRQLKYDGAYSAVTFICSKTDDISVTEAVESLNLEERVSQHETQIRSKEDEIKKLKKKLGDLKDQEAACDEIRDHLDEEMEKWDVLLDKLDKGEQVYDPAEAQQTKKRKRHGRARGSRKRRNNDPIDSDSGSSSDSGSDGDGNDSDAELSDLSDKENSDPKAGEEKKPLTKEEIENKISSLREEKKKIRSGIRDLKDQAKETRTAIKEIESEKKNLESEVKAICIQGRNEYSRTAIKKDFAMGIKELDQETAIEEDEENFDPDVDLRDYDKVAETLPVFCVSSRAFQKLSGRLVRDKFNSAGFRSLEETEIPQLQAHAQKLTENGRAASCRRFLADLSQLLNSLSMWATNDGTRSNLTDSEKRAEENHLRKRIDQMEQELDDVVKETMNNLKEALAENIYEIFEKYLPVAADRALPTATGWGAHRDAGGLLWSTYRATCRRNGVFSGASGPRDFNAELIEPIHTPLSTTWERTFQRRLPGVLTNFAKSTKLLLETFHREATIRTQQRANNYHGINMLYQQLQAHCQKISELPDALNAIVQEQQRDANRSFAPTIQTQMERTYQACAEERGSGCFRRMKDIMEAHVGTQRMSIFQAATRVVQDQLGVMCRELKKRLQDEADDLHDILRRDYLSALVGSEVANRKGLPRVERTLRAEMVPYLQKTDPLFAPVVKGEPEEPEKVEEPEEPKQERAASESLFVPPDAAANEAADDHDTTMVDASIVDTSVVDASMVDAPPPSSGPTATSTIKAEPVEPAPLLSSNQASVPAIKNEHAAPVQPAVEPSRAPSVAAPEAAARPEPLQAGTAASEVVQAVGVAHERARAATAGPDAVGTAIAVPQPLRAATTDPDPISNIKREPQGDHNLLASFCSERNPTSDDEEEFSTATEGEEDEGEDDEDDDNAESSSDEDSSRAPSVEMDLVKPEPIDH
ncbi:hypothetical protein GE21DRAFT_6469 [Neurospora crassa]|uniref:Tat pathway signal sequence n=1 Tax=Neurospora crassa (strain ATCC 24698 / 74-OR23-1A / CBS 708.71 / DSM 1257 / FGSC 987) TaxID=367110 RepID=Q7SAH0_NEUCR|nr:hypothetical protein NCU06980 [Neurospora crassa OR74A]EAA33384.2 hypothetical protein NCU06980 [Neurospora crassa OR74A]KHE81283.1 hypothetical protein GE21DRAFT_6469 [Neurospora crassa]|eukprot:XP_962620.2 hypothetical protein NCU06980 [Neurospora crassa OR74A]